MQERKKNGGMILIDNYNLICLFGKLFHRTLCIGEVYIPDSEYYSYRQWILEHIKRRKESKVWWETSGIKERLMEIIENERSKNV